MKERLGCGVGTGVAKSNAGANPSSWPNLTLLLDSMAGVTAAGDPLKVSLWEDQSTAGHDFNVVISSKKPHLLLSVVVADGVDDTLNGNAMSYDSMAKVGGGEAGAYSLAARFNPLSVSSDINSGGDYWDNDGIIGDISGYWGIHLRSSGLLGAYHYNSAVVVQEAAITIGVRNTVGVIFTGTTSQTLKLRTNQGSWASISADVPDETNHAMKLFGLFSSNVALEQIAIVSKEMPEDLVAEAMTYLDSI